MTRLIQNFAARLALFAVLLHAFAPMASHAMMAKSGKSFVEICTAQGFQVVEVDVDGVTQKFPLHKVGHECAACHLAASALALPESSAAPIVYLAVISQAVRHRHCSVVLSSTIRLTPPPTGPPDSLV
jgi:hypothetical protein